MSHFYSWMKSKLWFHWIKVSWIVANVENQDVSDNYFVYRDTLRLFNENLSSCLIIYVGKKQINEIVLFEIGHLVLSIHHSMFILETNSE